MSNELSFNETRLFWGYVFALTWLAITVLVGWAMAPMGLIILVVFNVIVGAILVLLYEQVWLARKREETRR